MAKELTRRLATESDRRFVWETNRRAYEDVVVRQFGEWNDELQRGYFHDKWEEADFEVVELGGERVGAIWTTDEGDHLQLREVLDGGRLNPTSPAELVALTGREDEELRNAWSAEQ